MLTKTAIAILVTEPRKGSGESSFRITISAMGTFEQRTAQSCPAR